MISREFKKSELLFTPTGGSTGEPLKLYQHKNNYDLKKAMILRGNSWGGLDINERHILLWGGPNEITFANTLKGRFRHGIMSRKLLDTFFLQPENMRKYIKIINKFKPVAITGYANSLYTFSKFIKENKLKIYSPNTIFSTAEMLLDFQRDMIEDVFRCKVLNWYGCREVGEIAQQCNKGNMHINTDCLIVEFIRNDKPVKKGDTGSVIITDLNNFSMPLIRYEIGDLGVPSKKNKCSCGRNFPIMEVSKGRVSDMFQMPDGRVIHGEYFTYLFYDLEGLKQFQLIQKKKDLIVIKVVKEPRLSEEEVIGTIKSLMKGKIDKRVRLEFEFPKKINPEKSGKFCFTRSEVKLDF